MRRYTRAEFGVLSMLVAASLLGVQTHAGPQTAEGKALRMVIPAAAIAGALTAGAARMPFPTLPPTPIQSGVYGKPSAVAHAGYIAPSAIVHTVSAAGNPSRATIAVSQAAGPFAWAKDAFEGVSGANAPLILNQAYTGAGSRKEFDPVPPPAAGEGRLTHDLAPASSRVKNATGPTVAGPVANTGRRRTLPSPLLLWAAGLFISIIPATGARFWAQGADENPTEDEIAARAFDRYETARRNGGKGMAVSILGLFAFASSGYLFPQFCRGILQMYSNLTRLPALSSLIFVTAAFIALPMTAFLRHRRIIEWPQAVSYVDAAFGQSRGTESGAAVAKRLMSDPKFIPYLNRLEFELQAYIALKVRSHDALSVRA